MNDARFLAVVSSCDAPPGGFADIVAAGKKTGLETIYQHGRLCVLAGNSAEWAPMRRAQGARSGVIIGQAFPKNGVISTAPDRAGSRSCAAESPADMWGAFIAFQTNDAEHSIDVMRDPSGMAPCYFARQGNEVWLFSDLKSALSAGLKTPAIDWKALTQYLACPHLRGRRSCLAGVEQLGPGARLRFQKGQPLIQEKAWTPWTYAEESRRVRSYDDAVATLRAAIIECISGWASRSGRILLELSGGLDSAIIAASLREIGADFSCVTFAGDDPSSDERAHARRVASHLGVPLAELHLEGGEARIDPQSPNITAYPSATPWGGLIDRAVSGVAAAERAQNIYSGGGGDNVFCYLTTAAPAADALRAYGPGPQFFEALRDVAALHGASYWRAARYAVRKAYFTRPVLLRRNFAFLNGDAAMPPVEPPLWLQDMPRRVRPGRAEHAASIASAASVSDGAERILNRPLRYPLLSSPLIEFCLGVPSWMWVRGGRNRAPARDAYADRLPSETLVRRSKGDLTGLIAEIYAMNKNQITELLLEGRLAREGVIDRDAAAARLQSDAPFLDAGFTRLVWLAAAECWVQSWSP